MSAASFTAKTVAKRPLLPADTAQEGAQLLHSIMESGQVVATGRAGIIVITLACDAATFDRLTSWDADWAEREDDTEDTDAWGTEDGHEAIGDLTIASLAYAEDMDAIPEPNGGSQHADWSVRAGLDDEREPDELVGAYL